MNKVRLRQAIQDVAAKMMASRFASFVSKAMIPASYISGNPPIQQGHETPSTFGAKTHKVLLLYNNIANKPAAGDAVAFAADSDGNRYVQGKLVDVTDAIVDATSLAGLRPVEPGNTLLSGVSLDTERSTNSTSYVEVKRWKTSRPGRYRIKLKLARSGGITQAIVRVRLSDGTLIDATAAASQNTTTHPTYGSEQSLDMTIPVDSGAVCALYLLNDSGPAQTGYVKEVRVYYRDIISALGSHDLALID